MNKAKEIFQAEVMAAWEKTSGFGTAGYASEAKLEHALTESEITELIDVYVNCYRLTVSIRESILAIITRYHILRPAPVLKKGWRIVDLNKEEITYGDLFFHPKRGEWVEAVSDNGDLHHHIEGNYLNLVVKRYAFIGEDINQPEPTVEDVARKAFEAYINDVFKTDTAFKLFYDKTYEVYRPCEIHERWLVWKAAKGIK